MWPQAKPREVLISSVIGEILWVHGDKIRNRRQPGEGAHRAVLRYPDLHWTNFWIKPFYIPTRREEIPFFLDSAERAQFAWIEEAHEAFDELKKFLASLPILTKPILGEADILHIRKADNF